jgi:hypothetical protein
MSWCASITVSFRAPLPDSPEIVKSTQAPVFGKVKVLVTSAALGKRIRPPGLVNTTV